MRNPQISFILVGITRSKDDPFATHMKGYLSSPHTLEGLRLYNEQGKIPGKPDVVYLATGQDLAKMKDGKLSTGVAGLAFVGGVCTSTFVSEGEDTPMTYDGTQAMAHELGHLLGSPHDDGWSKDPECAWDQGYLMSYVDGGVKSYRLSKCSEDKIRSIFKMLKPECIEVKANQNYQKDHRKFPGQTVREEFYCKKILKKHNGNRNKVIVKKDPQFTRRCKMNCCTRHMNGLYCIRATIPAGMACDRGKTCKRGVCGVHTWEQFK
ncbi:disintegrin and metalloproteinase domain-containing protein 7 [Dermacentor silvarum]|uniref:disintegrin and metalloproteinase domain-containing protein 7 n=2 Tax=Dermacentor silvarum TaxID=543639 RepID=UPI00189B3F49|nr:disintegrin and metalloproteinase domain-containing protein 7 [Dermacentor silvarum]